MEKNFDDTLRSTCVINTEAEADKNVKQEGESDFSDQFKRRMNRLFREEVGVKEVPHPEVDTLYERIRSYIVRRILLFRHHHSKSKHNKAENKQ